MKILMQNGLLALMAMAVPLIAQYATASADNVPGTGFSVLLYEPFNFAYLLMVTAIFVFINIRCSMKSDGSAISGALIGLCISVLWFSLAFLAVGEMHLGMGGKL